MSLRSKPLLQCRFIKKCAAFTQAARRSGLAAYVPFLYVASLQTAFAVSIQPSDIPANQLAGQLSAQGKSAVPHFFDGCGQTHNYFTTQRFHAHPNKAATAKIVTTSRATPSRSV
jgi:hypothetical protein